LLNPYIRLHKAKKNKMMKNISIVKVTYSQTHVERWSEKSLSSIQSFVFVCPMINISVSIKVEMGPDPT